MSECAPAARCPAELVSRDMSTICRTYSWVVCIAAQIFNIRPVQPFSQLVATIFRLKDFLSKVLALTPNAKKV